MPAYRFCDDILYPYVQISSQYKKLRTQEADAWIARKLEEFFEGWWLTDRRSEVKRVISGETVTAYRAKRKLDGVAASSIKRELAVASAAVNYAISELNYDISNPFAGRLMSQRDRKATVRRKRILTTGEVNALIVAATGVTRDIIVFAAATGFRQSEILGLRWDHVRGDEVVFEPHEQKSGRRSVRGLSETALAVLARRGDGEVVFALDGKRIPRRTFHSLWDDVRKRAGVDDVKFHDLRRFLATQMLAVGRMEDVKTQLGHSDIRTTQAAYAEDSIDAAKGVLGKMRGIDCG